MEYRNEYFDAVHSRDAILHIKEKSKLFANMFKCLKPGGKLLITDYCSKQSSSSNDPEFVEYVSRFNYHMLTVQEYGNHLKDAGFVDVVAIDNSQHFLDILKKELDILLDENTETEIKRLASEGEYTSWLNLWKGKIKRVENGDHVWGLFTACKPLT